MTETEGMVSAWKFNGFAKAFGRVKTKATHCIKTVRLPNNCPLTTRRCEVFYKKSSFLDNVLSSQFLDGLADI